MFIFFKVDGSTSDCTLAISYPSSWVNQPSKLDIYMQWQEVTKYCLVLPLVCFFCKIRCVGLTKSICFL
uniref:Uncharacterized protein n=1 Tax=Rhizophora mucronata TaxID=61149 RepID=A0A2P2Q7W3_RHIMU